MQRCYSCSTHSFSKNSHQVSHKTLKNVQKFRSIGTILHNHNTVITERKDSIKTNDSLVLVSRHQMIYFHRFKSTIIRTRFYSHKSQNYHNYINIHNQTWIPSDPNISPQLKHALNSLPIISKGTIQHKISPVTINNILNIKTKRIKVVSMQFCYDYNNHLSNKHDLHQMNTKKFFIATWTAQTFQ